MCVNLLNTMLHSMSILLCCTWHVLITKTAFNVVHETQTAPPAQRSVRPGLERGSSPSPTLESLCASPASTTPSRKPSAAASRSPSALATWWRRREASATSSGPCGWLWKNSPMGDDGRDEPTSRLPARSVPTFLVTLPHPSTKMWNAICQQRYSISAQINSRN